MMEEQSLKKFDRIIAILVQLQSRRLVRAQDLADRFEVSLRTIYRDIKTLESAGVPVIGESGTGYSLMDGYKLPPVMFSREEASSFVAAEKLSEKYLDKTLGGYFRSAMAKIKAVLKWSEKEMMDHLTLSVRTAGSDMNTAENARDNLALLMDAIIHKKQVRLDYRAFDSEKSVQRDIEPIGLYHDYQVWYLMAYCHLRGDYRQFRTDRMLQVEVLHEPFLLKHKSLDHFLAVPKRPDTEEVEVVLRTDQRSVRYMMSTRQRYGFVREVEKDGNVEMYFKVDANHMGFLVRWLMTYLDVVEIVSPDLLRQKAGDYLRKIQDRLAL